MSYTKIMEDKLQYYIHIDQNPMDVEDIKENFHILLNILYF